eukprot:augustus_masked-scaffold_122-processed-gene-0.8-mRNA-1 protein AED:1.00 eAED:1.00 QI:0/0/0/0/1/1/5/0/467
MEGKQAELFGADSTLAEEAEDTDGWNEEKDRYQELSDREADALMKSLNLPLEDEIEEVADPGTSDDEITTINQRTADKATCAVHSEAEGQDSPELDVVAGEDNISIAEESKAVENNEVENDKEAENEDEAENENSAVNDEAEVMDLTQPLQDDEAPSSYDALVVKSATNLARLISNGRNKMAEAVNLTSPPTTKAKVAPKAPRKRRMSKKQCEFYLKKPRWFTPKKYVLCKDDLRQVQKKMKGKTVADRAMAVLRDNVPKPKFSAYDDPDRPRLIKPFKLAAKAEPAAGESMRAPRRKVRPSEHAKTDKEKRMQEYINALTTERKKNNAELKKLSKELKKVKKLYRAEVEKVKELQETAYKCSNAFEPNPQQPPTPKPTPAHGITFSDFAETAQESVYNLLANINGVHDGGEEPNLWIDVDPKLKQNLLRAGVGKEGLVDYLRKNMREHEAYKGVLCAPSQKGLGLG